MPDRGQARPVTADPAQPVAVAGPAVVLQGPRLAEVHQLLVRGIEHARQRDAIAPSPELLQLVRLVRSAATEYRRQAGMSPWRHAGGDLDDDLPSSARRQVTAAEAAQLIGLSVRQVQRRAAEWDGYRAGRILLLDRQAVEGEAARRGRAEE